MRTSPNPAPKSGTLLVTGGTGSLGQQLVKALVKQTAWKEIRIFSRDEYKQYLLRQQYPQKHLHMILGDVRDPQRLRQALRGCTHVLHLAAMKHVPACEAHPSEAVHTNVLGAVHLADAAKEAGVQRFLFISTDKAVSPINLYGASKLVAEKIFLAANQGSAHQTQFQGIRFGNFFGSRGDVISLFRQQKTSGKLTVTDRRMTRFWLPFDQAVDFTLKCLCEEGSPGIFVPKMKSLKLTTLAAVLGEQCRIVEVGRRPGEKLHEWLIHQDEAYLVRDFGSYYQLFENSHLAEASTGKRVPEDFQLRSDLATQWWDETSLEPVLQDALVGLDSVLA